MRTLLYFLAAAAYVILTAGTFAGLSEAPTKVVVTAAGREYAVFALPHYGQVEIPGPLGKTVVTIEGRRARVVSSPCSNKICVGRGWLTRKGDYAICLPNRVAARLE